MDKKTEYKGFNFTELREKKKLSAEDMAEMIGVTAEKLEAFEAGYNNPMRGPLFNGVAETLEIEPIRLKAFLMWRRDKWQAWEDAGCPENDPNHTWDDVKDYNGENLEDLGYFEVDESEELSEAEGADLKDSLEKDKSKNPFGM